MALNSIYNDWKQTVCGIAIAPMKTKINLFN